MALSQASYIDKVLARFSMQNSKKGLLPARHGITLSKEQCPKTPQEEEDMRRVPYALGIGIVSRYQSNPRLDHWITVKQILKYLMRMRDHMLVYSGGDLNCNDYSESDF